MRHFRILTITTLIVLAFGTFASAAPARAINRLTLSISPSYLYFGNQIVGTSSLPQNITITNTGSANVRLDKLNATDEFILRARDCNGKTLLPNQSCTFSVSFQPLTVGYKTGFVSIPNSETAPISISLTGYGISGTNLLKATTFELPIYKPVPWKGQPASVTLTYALDCAVGLSPFCSARLKGSPLNFAKSLTQSIGHVGLAGDKYIFRLSSRANAIPAGGQYKVEVKLLNMYNQVVGSKTIHFTDGTHEFETVMGTITAQAQYTWVVFRFTLQKPSGTAWFDNAELVKLP